MDKDKDKDKKEESEEEDDDEDEEDTSKDDGMQRGSKGPKNSASPIMSLANALKLLRQEKTSSVLNKIADIYFDSGVVFSVSDPPVRCSPPPPRCGSNRRQCGPVAQAATRLAAFRHLRCTFR